MDIKDILYKINNIQASDVKTSSTITITDKTSNGDITFTINNLEDAVRTLFDRDYKISSKTQNIDLPEGYVQIEKGRVVSGPIYSLASLGNISGQDGITPIQYTGISMQQSNGTNYPESLGNVLNLKASTGLCTQLFLGTGDSNGSAGKMFIRNKEAAADGEWSNWSRVYTTMHPPTANEIGALPLTGGTVSGKVTINGGLDSTATTNLRGVTNISNTLTVSGGFNINTAATMTGKLTLTDYLQVDKQIDCMGGMYLQKALTVATNISLAGTEERRIMHSGNPNNYYAYFNLSGIGYYDGKNKRTIWNYSESNNRMNVIGIQAENHVVAKGKLAIQSSAQYLSIMFGNLADGARIEYNTGTQTYVFAKATGQYANLYAETLTTTGSFIKINGKKLSISSSAPSSPATGDIWIQI